MPHRRTLKLFTSKKEKSLWILGILFIFFSSGVEAQYFQMDLMKKRQANKDKSRWTLAGWLSQKQQIALWDQWLEENSSANYVELQLGGGLWDFEQTTDSGSGVTTLEETASQYSLDFWLLALGARIEHRDVDEISEATTVSGNFRLLGSSLQSTHLLIRGGYERRKNLSNGQVWDLPFAAASLRFYLASFLGLNGEYRYFLEDESGGGYELSGDSWSAGGFLEWGFLRLYTRQVQENSQLKFGGVTQDIERAGLESGIRLIF